MYQYPIEVQIGGHSFKIHLQNVSKIDDHAQFVGDVNLYQCDIRVSTLCCNGEPKALSYIEETLIHEIVHAINEVYNANLDEKQVDTLAQGMTQVLKSIGIDLVRKE